jgi:hypothetical protein
MLLSMSMSTSPCTKTCLPWARCKSWSVFSRSILHKCLQVAQKSAEERKSHRSRTGDLQVPIFLARRGPTQSCARTIRCLVFDFHCLHMRRTRGELAALVPLESERCAGSRERLAISAALESVELTLKVVRCAIQGFPRGQNPPNTHVL